MIPRPRRVACPFDVHSVFRNSGQPGARLSQGDHHLPELRTSTKSSQTSGGGGGFVAVTFGGCVAKNHSRGLLGLEPCLFSLSTTAGKCEIGPRSCCWTWLSVISAFAQWKHVKYRSTSFWYQQSSHVPLGAMPARGFFARRSLLCCAPPGPCWARGERHPPGHGEVGGVLQL